MRYVRFVCLFVVIILSFSFSVFAEPEQPSDFVDESNVPLETSPDPQVVIIDPGSIQDIADALLPTETIPENTEEPTTPVIDISPDSISALASAIASASGSGIGDTDISDNPIEKLKDGYYFTCNCVLGDDLTIYVPVEFSIGGFSIDDNGRLRNMTSNPFRTRVHVGRKTYIISADSMSGFVYWENKLLGEGDVIQALNLNETVTDSNISFLHNTPQAVPTSVYFAIIISLIFLFGILGLIWRR